MEVGQYRWEELGEGGSLQHWLQGHTKWKVQGLFMLKSSIFRPKEFLDLLLLKSGVKGLLKGGNSIIWKPQASENKSD